MPAGSLYRIAMSSGAAALRRRITAYHEAAHAVVALRFRIPIEEVALCHVGPVNGYVQMLDVPLIPKVARNDHSSLLTWTLVARATEQQSMVLLAGVVAEAKLLGTPLRAHCGESDLSRCLHLCWLLDCYRRALVDTQAMVIPEEKPIDMANRLRQRTRQILGHPRTWRAVTALADDLEGWSRLTGHDAADTVQWTRRIKNQLALLLPMPRNASQSDESGVPRVADATLRSCFGSSSGFLPAPGQRQIRPFVSQCTPSRTPSLSACAAPAGPTTAFDTHPRDSRRVAWQQSTQP